MAPLTTIVTAAPAAADLETLGQSLAAFNDADVGPSGRLPLAVLVKEGETLVAGLSGYTAWGWLYTQWLWVAETHRGRRLAAAMLTEAETEARRRACHGAHIDSFNPDALRVYERAGYTIFGTLPDFPPGRTRFFLSKSLR